MIQTGIVTIGSMIGMLALTGTMALVMAGRRQMVFDRTVGEIVMS